MDTTRITLTLNREQRKIDAGVITIAQDTRLIVHDIALRTAQGQKTHIGYLWLKAQAPGHLYSAQDITEIGYPGMRGNGHGQTSLFRYIGFLAAN